MPLPPQIRKGNGTSANKINAGGQDSAYKINSGTSAKNKKDKCDGCRPLPKIKIAMGGRPLPPPNKINGAKRVTLGMP